MSTRARSSNPLRWLTPERLKARTRKHAKHAKHNPPACGCAAPNPQRLTREEFDRRYWKVTPDTPQGAAGVPVATRREFYSDYRESGLSFAAYVKSTTTPVDQRYNPKDRTLTERAMLMREQLHRLDEAAANMYRPGWEGRNKKAHAHRLRLAAVNQELGQGMSETSEAWRTWRKAKGAPAVRNPAVTPAGWRNTTATNDGYRAYARQVGNVEMKIDGFEPETCNRLGLPVVWSWSVSVISGPYRQRHDTAPALKLAVARAEAAAEKLNAPSASSAPRAKAPKTNPFRPELVRKGGAVYGYGVWDETANDYVKRAGKPFMTDRGGAAHALARRMTARERGERPLRVTVTPVRAKQIINAAKRTAIGPWSDSLDANMSPGERAYVTAVWNRMSGSASFVSALMAIANDRVPAKGRIS